MISNKHRRLISPFLILTTMLMLAGRTSASVPHPIPSILQSMTLEQKVGQMFMITLCGQRMPEASEKFIREIAPGGVALFTCNGTTPEDVTDTVNEWQRVATSSGAKIPLIVSIDQEGGPVKRLPDRDGYAALPAGWALGAMPAKDAETVGRIAAAELRAVGISMNLAPVADVQTIPVNPIMNRRNLGSFPQNVGAKVSAYAIGLQAGGVMGVLKHFPGHGDADDSHTILPTVDYPRRQVDDHLQPFKAGIDAGVEAVMVGHLVYPALDPEKLPASLSKAVISGVLRDQLGFRGLVVTDAMDMGAIVDHYAKDKAAIMAVNAGVDMIITGPHMPAGGQLLMIRAVIEAVRDGTISETRIDESVKHILDLKQKYGVLNWQPLDRNTARKRLDSEAHTAQLAQVWRNTATIASNPKGLLPLKPGAKTLLIFPGIYPSIVRACRVYDAGAATFAYSQQAQPAEIASSITLSRNADAVIVFTYDAVDAPTVQTLIKSLPPEKTIVAALQSPYDLTLFPGIAGGAASYMPYLPAFESLCGVLYGVIPAKGTFPISLWVASGAAAG
jgi:beta-N-acetylhexosaminidase